MGMRGSGLEGTGHLKDYVLRRLDVHSSDEGEGSCSGDSELVQSPAQRPTRPLPLDTPDSTAMPCLIAASKRIRIGKVVATTIALQAGFRHLFVTVDHDILVLSG